MERMFSAPLFDFLTHYTTLVAALLQVVCPGGLVSIMCYIGHPGGLEECEQVGVVYTRLCLHDIRHASHTGAVPGAQPP
jgi:hypothetical protein